MIYGCIIIILESKEVFLFPFISKKVPEYGFDVMISFVQLYHIKKLFKYKNGSQTSTAQLFYDEGRFVSQYWV